MTRLEPGGRWSRSLTNDRSTLAPDDNEFILVNIGQRLHVDAGSSHPDQSHQHERPARQQRPVGRAYSTASGAYSS